MSSNRKNSASKSSSKSARANSKPKNKGGKEKQKRQSLSKDKAKKIWSEHKKNAEKDLKKYFLGAQSRAKKELQLIRAGKKKAKSKAQLKFFKDIENMEWATYRANHRTRAEVDKDTWDNRIVTSGNPNARTSRSPRYQKEIPWAKDPSKSDYPFIDHPDPEKKDLDKLANSNYWGAKGKKKIPTPIDYVVYKRELGNKFIDVNDSRQALKQYHFRFDNIFDAKANELERKKLISPNERRGYQNAIEKIIETNSDNGKWNFRLLKLQKRIFNEHELLKEKEKLAKSMEKDFQIINALEGKVTGMKTTYFEKTRGEEVESKKLIKDKQKNERELNYLRYGDPIAKKHIELIDERRRLEKAIKKANPKRKKQLQDILNRLITDNKKVTFRMEHTSSQPLGTNITYGTKVSDSEYLKILAKAKGLYEKHAFVRDALNRQEKYFKVTHNKHIYSTRTIPRNKYQKRYYQEQQKVFEKKIDKLHKKYEIETDAKKKTKLESQIYNLVYGDPRAQRTLDKIRNGEINPLKKDDWKKLNLKALGLEGVKSAFELQQQLKDLSLGTKDMGGLEKQLSQKIDIAKQASKESMFSDRFFSIDTVNTYIKLQKQMDENEKRIAKERQSEEDWKQSLKQYKPKEYMDYERDLGDVLKLDYAEKNQFEDLVSLFEKAKTKKQRENWVSLLKEVKSPRVRKSFDIYYLYFSNEANARKRRRKRTLTEMPLGLKKQLESLEKESRLAKNQEELNKINARINSLMTEVEITEVEQLQEDISVPINKWESHIKKKLQYKT